MISFNILVVNDDGINAIGIKILATKLLKYGNVYVVSPDRGRSAASHKVILHKPLTFEHVDVIESAKCYQKSGMPADCVRLANIILDVDFDIVISGVNDGLNLGTDIIYSGTCAGAGAAGDDGEDGSTGISGATGSSGLSGTTGVNTTGTSASIKEIPYVYDKYKLDQIIL